MKHIHILLALVFSLFLSACTQSDASKGSADKNNRPQSSIRLQDIPSKDLGSGLQLKDIPEGDYLLSSITFTWINPSFDASFKHSLMTPGEMNENDSVVISRQVGTSAYSFSMGIPYEIHSSPTEIALIDLRQYHGGFDEDDTFNWQLDKRGEEPFPDHIGRLLKEATWAQDGTYKVEIKNFSKSYTIAVQASGDILYISVLEKYLESTPLDGEVRYQLAFEKGNSLGDEPKSVVLPKN